MDVCVVRVYFFGSSVELARVDTPKNGQFFFKCVCVFLLFRWEKPPALDRCRVCSFRLPRSPSLTPTVLAATDGATESSIVSDVSDVHPFCCLVDGQTWRG